MNTVTKDVMDLFVDQTFGEEGSQTGWGIFIGSEPEKLNTTITLYDTGGPRPDACFNVSIKPLRYDTFQIRVRATTYTGAWSKLQELTNYLDTLTAFIVSGNVRYMRMKQMTAPMFLEETKNNRFIWVADYQAFRIITS